MTDRLNIAVVCFPTFGGSGVIATEVGLGMAERGHRVHFIAHDLPVRLHGISQNVLFHEVTESSYAALAQTSAYPIALASKMIELATFEQLDILHVHYAVPHATAAWMAREVLGAAAPRLITTLHGTDITLVGSDPSHQPITRFSIQKSDIVTTPSRFLREATWSQLDIPSSFPIEVIPNFVDTEVYASRRRAGPRGDRPALGALFAETPVQVGDDAVLFHVSNFRSVKRVLDVVAVFAEVAARTPARLVMLGDGPDRSMAERRVRELGLADRTAFLGKQKSFAELLALADVFLLPSASESFGLAALEAQSCGVPVVATDIGGIPEVIAHGDTGLLSPLGDVAAMATHVLDLVTDSARWHRYSQQARQRVLDRFQLGPALDRYEALYRQAIARR